MKIAFTLSFLLSLNIGLMAQTFSLQMDKDTSDLASPNLSFYIFSNTDVLNNLNIPIPKQNLENKRSLMVLQPSLLSTAFFCKFEHKLDRSSNFPMKFRLGDIDYTNAIEGKNRFDVSSFTKEQRSKN